MEYLSKTDYKGLTNRFSETIMVKGVFCVVRRQMCVSRSSRRSLRDTHRTQERMEQQLWTVGLLITRKLKTGESAYLHCILKNGLRDLSFRPAAAQESMLWFNLIRKERKESRT